MNNLTIAAKRPLNLIVLVLALISGGIVSLWLLPVGLVVYGAAVVLAARDPNLTARAQRPPPRALDLPKLSSPTFRTIVAEIDRSQREIERTLGRAPTPLGKALQPMILQSRELVVEAHNLASKGQIIEQYLASSNPRQLQDQISGLDIQIANTKDTYTIQQLQEVRTSLLDRQRNANDLQTYIGRINAQLANIDASLDNVLAEAVRLLTADAVSASSMSGQVAERLSDMRADMDAFQRMLDSAMTGI
ncbi:hypothetical protein OSCT_2283 [Oscillochloris trichoides DG-6]|uniref:Uncharacterized protein n=1 Tax=Oscillochloris trichoides DG-6 TaxID=765420 RepID=E1IG32_9CHLR|nr:hypothetical protein [Oscillochloris trichoides]EFO79849.1 hypothetical protein OSCT_2283 [Oscillochloris trichoides DG-6]